MIYGRTNKPYHHVPPSISQLRRGMASPVPARLAAAPSPSARRSPRCSPPPRWRRRWCAGRPSPGVWKPGAKRGAKMVMSNQGKLGCFVCGIAAYLDVLVDVYLFELDWIGLISCMFKYRHTLTRWNYTGKRGRPLEGNGIPLTV